MPENSIKPERVRFSVLSAGCESGPSFQSWQSQFVKARRQETWRALARSLPSLLISTFLTHPAITYQEK